MPLLVLLFILVPIAEIYVIIQVGQAIGALWTILILIADSIDRRAAAALAGPRAPGPRFQQALGGGPHAAPRGPRRRADHRRRRFLLTPGFITDVFGLLLLIPPHAGGVPRACSTRIDAAPPPAGLGASRGRDPRGPRAAADRPTRRADAAAAGPSADPADPDDRRRR